ncbi:MAG: tetratricopeptide repeat protein [Burkholderiales bacterium]|nr:tetratricopeptide repeat protein [Burkholderiales bacterium]
MPAHRPEPSPFDAGLALVRAGRAQEALVRLQQAVAADPAHANAYNAMGAALRMLQRPAEALRSFEQAIAAAPGHAAAHSNRGIMLAELKQPEAAIESFDRALALDPRLADALSNRGKVRIDLGQPEAALADFDEAIRQAPGFAEAHHNRGIVLRQLRQREAARASFEQAVRLKPESADARSSLGCAELERNRVDAALRHFDAALLSQPGHAEARWNKALALLLAGRFGEGWPLYEARWDRTAASRRPFRQPQWTGREPLAGRTILLHAEQGLGDTLQFCRYVPQVAAAGATVLLEVQPPLAPLLRQLPGVATLVMQGEPLPRFDLQCPLLSLPLAFGTTLGSIPAASGPYLQAPSDRLALWGERLGATSSVRVGLAWSGRAEHRNDHNRGLALERLAAHLPPGFDYVSLQQDVRAADREVLAAHPHIRHFGDALADFGDTAALCSLVDVVLTVDTSIAHLAGALGRTAWVLLPFAPDWRWLLEREDSPWYASLRLFRQPAPIEWDPVLARAAGELRRLARAAPRA